MKVVVDASVAVKWLVRETEVEADVEQALGLLDGIRQGALTMIQPPHWLAEVAAVISRVHPEAAEEAIDLLDAMEIPVAHDVDVYQRASRLAITLDHHLFDTLYHAVAIERDATLVTADGRYGRKAQTLGRLIHLRDWSMPVDERIDSPASSSPR